jgi:hypothetical protein
MAPSGGFFGQVLLSITYVRPDRPKIHNGSNVFAFLRVQRWAIAAGKIAMPIYPNITYPWVL